MLSYEITVSETYCFIAIIMSIEFPVSIYELNYLLIHYSKKTCQTNILLCFGPITTDCSNLVKPVCL